MPETIAAVVILSIAIPPMLWSIREGHGQRVDVVQVSRARWLAMEKVEEIIADRHSGTRGWAWLDPVRYPAEPTVPGFPGYTRTVTLTETEADLQTAGSGYMNVVVAVSWTNRESEIRTVTVSTVLTEFVP